MVASFERKASMALFRSVWLVAWMIAVMWFLVHWVRVGRTILEDMVGKLSKAFGVESWARLKNPRLYKVGVVT